jgi:hypothetical protein
MTTSSPIVYNSNSEKLSDYNMALSNYEMYKKSAPEIAKYYREHMEYIRNKPVRKDKTL